MINLTPEFKPESLPGIKNPMDRPWFFVGRLLESLPEPRVHHLCELTNPDKSPSQKPLKSEVIELKAYGKLSLGQCPWCQKIYWTVKTENRRIVESLLA